VRNTSVAYLELAVLDSKLIVSVPVDRADAVGLRAVMSPEEIEALLAVVRAPSGPEVAQWSRRFKENRERLRTGDIFTHAAIARDLTRRLESKGLSQAERDMLREARRPIAVEVSLSLGIPIDEAEGMLHAVQVEGAAVA